MKKRRLGRALAILAFASLVSGASAADFYQNKQIQFLIRAEPGGSYDLYMRTLAKYMAKYIPGSPTIIPVNMPGGGGLTSLTYLDKVSPHDGTALAMVTQTAPMEEALGTNPNLKTDLGKLNWIGNISEQNTFLVMRASSATKSVQDAESRVTLLAASGASGSDYILATLMNSMFGTRFKSVLGYRSSPEMDMAIQRGEAEGRFTTSLAGLFSANKEGAKAFRVILQIGTKVDPAYPNVPLLLNLPSSHKEVLRVISDVMSLGRPVATNSGVPEDRVALLRKAFDQTMRDPDFVKDAERQQLDVSPWSGDKTQHVVDDILHADADSLNTLRHAIVPRKGQ